LRLTQALLGVHTEIRTLEIVHVDQDFFGKYSRERADRVGLGVGGPTWAKLVRTAWVVDVVEGSA
jgi:hypothetical protein